MKQMLFISVFFIGSFAFACGDVANRVLKPINELKISSHILESDGLEKNVSVMNIYSYLPKQWVDFCFRPKKLSKVVEEWACSNCGNYGPYPIPDECPECGWNLEALKYL